MRSVYEIRRAMARAAASNVPMLLRTCQNLLPRFAGLDWSDAWCLQEQFAQPPTTSKGPKYRVHPQMQLCLPLHKYPSANDGEGAPVGQATYHQMYLPSPAKSAS